MVQIKEYQALGIFLVSIHQFWQWQIWIYKMQLRLVWLSF